MEWNAVSTIVRCFVVAASFFRERERERGKIDAKTSETGSASSKLVILLLVASSLILDERCQRNPPLCWKIQAGIGG